jgi:hypothetical protein
MWMQTLKPKMADGKVFVVVGAAHMFGPSGLVASMKADGYTVERLKGPVAAMPDPLTGPSAMKKRPAVDPMFVDAWSNAYRSTVPALCAEGSLLRSCFLPSMDECVQKMDAAIDMCVMQYADMLPAPPTGPMPEGGWSPLVSECIPTGQVLGGWASGTMGNAPVCHDVRTALDAHMY